MENLIIYDSAGRIYYQTSGDIQEPTGIPFIRVEIPEGKYLKSIDTSVTPHEPVYEDFSKSETALLQEQVAILQDTIDALVLASLEL